MSSEQSQQAPDSKPFLTKNWNEYTPVQKIGTVIIGIVACAVGFYIGLALVS